MRDLTLSEFPFLVSLATSESARDRQIWLRVAIDHFIAAEPDNPRAIDRFAEVVALQLDAADAATGLEIARKLAPCARTPARLLAKFASAELDACDYVLEHAVACDDRDLAEAAALGGRRAVAVARRKTLDPQIVSALAAQGDIEVLIALANNQSARLEDKTFLDLLRQARQFFDQKADRRLADALLQRRPVRPETAALFLCATPNQRLEILLAAQRLQLGRPPAAPVPTRSEWLDDLELAAVARQPKRFVAILAEALDCEPDLARRIVDDPSGEPLAVALAALGAANEVLVRVLISNDLQSGDSYRRIRALARLNNALNRDAAIMVVSALRGDPVALRRQQPSADAGAPAPPRAAAAGSGARPADSPKRRAAN